jgi:hypothetical protein
MDEVDPRILDLGTSWSEWSVSCLARFTTRGTSPQGPLDRRLGGPQSRSGRYGEVKIRDPSGLELRPLGHQPVASRYTDCATAAVIL